MEHTGISQGGSKSRGFSLSFSFSKQPKQQVPQKKTLSQIKLAMELSIQDLAGQDADRLRHKIRAVRDVRELWMLRSDMHQVIAKQQSQQSAAVTINALLPNFAGWLPKEQLVSI
jgi:hypothetical protein